MITPLRALLLILFSLQLLAQAPTEAAQVTGNAGLRRVAADALLAGGPDYRARFTKRGMRFEPALGEAVAVTQHLSLCAQSVRRGLHGLAPFAGDTVPTMAGPQQARRTVVYPHAPGVEERYAIAPEHVALSWQFAQRPPGRGDLVVRYQLDTSLPEPEPIAGGGVQFFLPDVGGVTIGAVTGVDALGHEVAGGMRYENGTLELSLPASFVEHAAYPLVLDPVIGTTLAVQNNNSSDYDPDVAYDDTWHVNLVVWTRTFSSQDRYVRGQLVYSTSGGLAGQLLLFGSDGYGRDPHVAVLQTRNRFGVAWTERDLFASESRLRFRTVDAINFTIVSDFTSALPGIGSYTSADVGADNENGDAFVLVYDDNFNNRIAARRMSYGAGSGLVVHPPVTVVADTVGIGEKVYSAPSISRTSSASGFLVAARRYRGIGPTRGVWTAVLANDAMTTGPSLMLDNTAFHQIDSPHVDGYGDRWLVAWQKTATGTSDSAVTCQHLSLVSGTTTLQAGAANSFGGTAISRAFSPEVAYTPGRSWLLYQSYLSVGGFQLRQQSINGSDCASCAGVVIGSIGQYDGNPAMATGVSSGCGYCENAMAVWDDGDDIWALRHETGSGAGAIGDLGGGCGNGGLQSFNHNPSLGSNAFTCRVGQLPASALVTVFNFAAASAMPLACGNCVWTPFETTVMLPVSNGAASVTFPIPCLNNLQGAVFETQWTTLDFTQAPCSLVTGLVLSERKLLTISN